MIIHIIIDIAAMLAVFTLGFCCGLLWDRGSKEKIPPELIPPADKMLPPAIRSIVERANADASPYAPKQAKPPLTRRLESLKRLQSEHVERWSNLPKGIDAVSLDHPAKMHNAIARAIGEPELPPTPQLKQTNTRLPDIPWGNG